MARRGRPPGAKNKNPRPPKPPKPRDKSKETYRDTYPRPQPSTEQVIEVIAEMKKPLEPGEKRKRQSVRATRARRERAVVDLILRKTPDAVIKKALDVSSSDIAHIRERFSPIFRALSNGEVEDYEAVRGKILTATELELLKSMMTEDRLAKAGVNQLAYAMKEVSQLRRLEAGQSTSNNAVSFTRIVRKE